MSLKGNDIIMGDSIIIFMVIRMEVMIKLMIRKGMNNIKLIWNVVFSLLVINVGIRIFNGILVGFWYLFLFLVIDMNVFKFFIWVCDNMKVCIGFFVCLMVFIEVIFFFRYGCNVCLLILLNMGVMMNIDKNKLILIRIWFDGDCCKLIVWCRIDNIIIIWVNDVIIIINVGSKFSVVIINSVCSVMV